MTIYRERAKGADSRPAATADPSDHALHSKPMGKRRAAGEIVEVEGGHIMRASGRKDRHSKVCTAKGPRDRRVRLAAHTAIQFYDVQDRLGFDRPSKAVDWLIKNAKAAIDELKELPPWHPTADPTGENYGTSSQIPQSNGEIAESFRSFFPADRGTPLSSHVEDLRLSLHSIPMDQHHQTSHFAWPDNWATDGGAARSPYMFDLPLPPYPQLLGQSSLIAQRQQPPPFLSPDAGFHIPARIRGDEENDGVSRC